MSTRWGKQKPPLGAQINWAHPLARGLVVATMFQDRNATRVYDTAANKRHASSGTLSTTIEGVQSSSAYIELENTPALAAVEYATVSIVGYKTTSASLQIIAEAWNSGFSPARYPFSVRLSSAGAFQVFAYDGTNNPNISTGVYNDGVPRNFVGIRRKGALEAYANGGLIGLATDTTSGTLATSSNFYLLSRGTTTGAPVIGAIGALFVWNRALLTQDVQWLNAEPYAFLQPPQPYRRFFGPTVAGDVTGSASITQASGTVSSAGVVAIDGTAAITQASGLVSAAGAVAIVGAAGITQESDSSASAGTVAIAGAAAITQAAQTLTAAGAVAIAGESSQTQVGNTVSTAGAVAIAGAASITQDGNTVSAEASSGTIGEAVINQAGNTVSASGAVAISGAASPTQAGTVAAAGTVLISGTAALSQAANMVSASGYSGNPTTEVVVGSVAYLGLIGSVTSLRPVCTVTPIAP